MPARLLARCVAHDCGFALVISSATMIGQLVWPLVTGAVGVGLLLVAQVSAFRVRRDDGRRGDGTRKGRCRRGK